MRDPLSELLLELLFVRWLWDDDAMLPWWLGLGITLGIAASIVLALYIW